MRTETHRDLLQRFDGWTSECRRSLLRTMANWKSGDVVRLKSGGPEMTVLRTVDTEHQGMVTRCAWFKDGAVIEHSFPPESLEGAQLGRDAFNAP